MAEATILTGPSPNQTTSEQRAAVLYDAPSVSGAEVLAVDSAPAGEADYSQMARDIGLDENDLSVFAQVRAEHRMVPPSEGNADEMKRKTFDFLAEFYGPKGAIEGVELVQKMAKADPRLSALLKTSVGNDHRIAARLVRLARNQKAAGKLK